MKQTKPYYLPSNEPSCYVTPEIMKQFDDEQDEDNWSKLLSRLEKLQSPRKVRCYE